MKILQVIARYYPDIGGMEEHVRNISERMTKQHDVSVVTTDPSGRQPEEEVIGGVKVKRFKSWAPNQAYFFSIGLWKYLLKNSDNFEVVHAHGYHSFPALYAANAKKGNRFVFTSHYFAMGATTFRTLLHVPYKVMGRKIFQKADAVISTSNYEKAQLISNFRIISDKVVVIPNGITLKDFQGRQKKHSHSEIILYVGRLEKFKGVDHLIRALPNLDKNTRLEIVGDGPHRRNLERLADRVGVKERVFFYGGNMPRKAIIQKYFEADLFALLSEAECFGIVVAEALAAGTPCIVSNTSALTEWVDNRNCFGIDYPIKTDELVALIRNTLGKTAEGTRLFDWDYVADRLMRIYCGDGR
jgi:glycosyltransferase involved in cell wall biosynthesis